MTNTAAPKSVLRAIGSSVSAGKYAIKFYYEFTQESGQFGGMDVSMPAWVIPARDWESMQATVRAFNGE